MPEDYSQWSCFEFDDSECVYFDLNDPWDKVLISRDRDMRNCLLSEEAFRQHLRDRFIGCAPGLLVNAMGCFVDDLRLVGILRFQDSLYFGATLEASETRLYLPVSLPSVADFLPGELRCFQQLFSGAFIGLPRSGTSIPAFKSRKDFVNMLLDRLEGDSVELLESFYTDCGGSELVTDGGELVAWCSLEFGALFRVDLPFSSIAIELFELWRKSSLGFDFWKWRRSDQTG